ncbi:MAG: AAA family ATPase [Frankia sp.]|nr:AAA family ATPase [Frankia sp.]
MTEPNLPSAREPAEGADATSDTDRPPIADLVAARLAAARLPDQVKSLIRDALGTAQPTSGTPTGRVYLESVAVAGYRGVGHRVALPLAPRPGVTLVVGRNGSGKSSIAEALETAFTGTNARWERADPVRRGKWRNMHDAARPKIEVKLRIEGDTERATLTREWSGDDFQADATGELRRPGHGKAPADQAGWMAALRDFRPFLSYVDLDHMISGRPTQMYDAIAVILGIGYVSAADRRLQEELKRLEDAEKAVRDETAPLRSELYELPDEDRALRALHAFDAPGGPDLALILSLATDLPATDDSLIGELRLTAEQRGPDLGRVDAATARLRAALDGVAAVRGTDAEDALRHAELLTQAIAFRARHAGDDARDCPVCGTAQVLDESWVAKAQAQVEALRLAGQTARKAWEELTAAERALRDLIQVPDRVPAALFDAWIDWEACREISEPAELAQRVPAAARALTEACERAATVAAAELRARDERWRPLYARLEAWARRADEVAANRGRARDIRKARGWLQELAKDLRTERMKDFDGQAQRIWEKLRQESNVSLKEVRLFGAERATVRRLDLDVSVDGADAPALAVMSQGEQHSLALALFLPRAATADSPFGFVVIDDPVQSMDPAKVSGLAQVLHELGQRRQVVVFTHDTRLQRAFTSQGLSATVWQVDRADGSKVTVRPVTDPVRQAFDDAMALARTSDLPEAARCHVLPSLCRLALENAFIDAAWIRHQRRGGHAASERQLQEIIAGADRFLPLAAMALLDDPGDWTANQVYAELTRLCGGSAVFLVKQCQRGAHPEGAQIDDPVAFVRFAEMIGEKVRKPAVPA